MLTSPEVTHLEEGLLTGTPYMFGKSVIRIKPYTHFPNSVSGYFPIIFTANYYFNRSAYKINSFFLRASLFEHNQNLASSKHILTSQKACIGIIEENEQLGVIHVVV